MEKRNITENILHKKFTQNRDKKFSGLLYTWRNASILSHPLSKDFIIVKNRCLYKLHTVILRTFSERSQYMNTLNYQSYKCLRLHGHICVHFLPFTFSGCVWGEGGEIILVQLIHLLKKKIEITENAEISKYLKTMKYWNSLCFLVAEQDGVHGTLLKCSLA